MSITDLAVKRPVSVTMLAGIIVVVGLMSLSRLGLDLMPDVDYPTLSIITRYEGASSEDIEKKVTRVLESAVAAVNGVSSVKSVSVEDASILMISFVWGTNLDFASQDIREALGLVDMLLPESADAPIVVKFSLSAFPVVGYGVSGMGGDTTALRRWIEDVVSQRLERLPGVAQLILMGGAAQEVQVKLDRAALEATGVGISQVQQALAFQNMDLPAGRVIDKGTDFLLRTRGEFTSLVQIRDTVVGAGLTGAAVRVGDIAKVSFGKEDVRNLTRTNGEPSMIMMVNKQSGTNSLLVARMIKKEIKSIQEELPGDIQFHLIMDTGAQIEQMARSVSRTGLLGGLLAVLFMYLFLRNIRPTVTIATAVPLSLLATLVLIYISGQTLNMMTMGGLMLGVGMLVDNAVVVIENIFRHLEGGKSREEAARIGAGEVAMAITASTLTTMVVFLPLFFGGGLAGQLVRGLAMVVAFALGASLLVAITVVPAMASVIFSEAGKEAQQAQESGWLLALRRRYERVLSWCLGHRKSALGIALGSLVAVLALTPLLGKEFLPGSDEPMILGKVIFPVGTPLSVTERATRRVEAFCKDLPGVETVGASVGVPEDDLGAGISDTNPEGVHEAQVFIRLSDERSVTQTQILDLLHEYKPDVEGMSVEFMDFGQALMGGSSKPVEVQILGPELDVLESLALKVKEEISGVEGLVDLTTSFRRAKPETHLVVDREKVASYGLSVGEVATTVEAATEGAIAGLFRQGADEYFIQVRYQEKDRSSFDAMARIQVPTRMGFSVPLSQLVRFEEASGPVKILRDDQSRRVSVLGSIQGRDLGSVVKDVKAAIEELKDQLPGGYTITFGGTYEQMVDAFGTLALALLVAVLLVYMVMASQFEAFVHPLVIMFTMPLATIGIVGVLLLTGKPISVAVFVGGIMLAGIVVNNGIVLIDYINQLRREGLERREAVQRGAATRFRAVLITSGTTIAGLLPMALFPGRQGQTASDMATVVAGGLAASTLLTLLIIPVLYELLDDVGDRVKAALLALLHAGGEAKESGGGSKRGAGAAAVVALALLLPGMGLSQDAGLSLQEAMESTLAANPNLRAAEELLPQARAQRDRAFALIQPQVSLGALYRINDREISLDTDSLAGAFTNVYENIGLIYRELFELGFLNGTLSGADCNEIAITNGYQSCVDMMAGGEPDIGPQSSEPLIIQQKYQTFLSADLQWPLSPRVLTLAKAGQAQVRASQAQIKQTRETLLHAVVQAFAGAFQTQEALVLIDEQLELVGAHRSQVEAMEELGVVTHEVVLRARIEEERLRRQRAEMERAKASTRRMLAVLMGQPDAEFGPLREPTQMEGEAPEEAGSTEERPDLLSARAQLAAAQAMKADAALQFLPSFAVTGSLLWSDKSAGFDNLKYSWNLGLGASLPLWDGGLLVQNARESASRLRQSQRYLEGLEAQARAELLDAREALATAQEKTEIATLEQELAEESYRLVDARFNSGAATQLELLDARANLQGAELARLQSRVERQVALADLLFKSGRLERDSLKGSR